MSERYWITGVQLGMLLAYTKDGSMHNEAMELGEGIIDKQFICPTEQTEPLKAHISDSNRYGDGTVDKDKIAPADTKEETQSEPTAEKQIEHELKKGLLPQDGGQE